jgi:hypothetical protein
MTAFLFPSNSGKFQDYVRKYVSYEEITLFNIPQFNPYHFQSFLWRQDDDDKHMPLEMVHRLKLLKALQSSPHRLLLYQVLSLNIGMEASCFPLVL